MTEVAATNFRVRPATDSDFDFLREVYIQARWEELSLLPVWTDDMRRAFLAQQAHLQHAHYGKHYGPLEYGVIEVQDGESIGRLYVLRSPTEIRIVDIALLPAWRNYGIGTVLITRILQQAAEQGARVTLHVEKNNPALRLYGRFGFRAVEDKGVYWFLEWRVGDQPSTPINPCSCSLPSSSITSRSIVFGSAS